MGMDEKDTVAKSAAVAERHCQPAPQRFGIGDVAGFHRPFEPARIGEGADRKSWRQPRHQAVKRGRAEGFCFR
jgi:hypothetical protein